MKVLLSWLQDFFSEKLNVQDTVDALIRIGLEVDEVEDLGKGLDGVVVARIEEAKAHPNADKLSLCKVFDGNETKDIVCGAKNFKTGDHVALATIGAELPNGLRIKKSKIRGETSYGMLCSDSELGFSEESDGILILDKEMAPGKSIREALDLDDAVLHLSLTPNRGDCFSVLGIAIELAASLDLKIKPPSNSMATFPAISIPVEVLDTKACPKYTLHRIENVKIGSSEDKISKRLERCGVRPVNNIVDFTNYIMLERGQPLHAFDADSVRGAIQVRFALENETIVTLDEEKRELTKDDLVIADETGPIAIAGVMGGLSTSVTDRTRNILLESALFDPRKVRMTSRRLNLVSDSSKRFEREIDPSSVLPVAKITADLIAENTGGKTAGSVQLDYLKTKPIKIHLTEDRINHTLGIEIPNAGEYLSRLGFSLEKMNDGWMVEVPPRRTEIQRDIDLIEEIARVYGYNQIPAKLPSQDIEPQIDSTYSRVDQLRNKIVAFGLRDARTYSFTSSTWNQVFGGESVDPVNVENPLTPDTTELRVSVLPGLLESWKINQSRQCAGVRLFELGNTFVSQKGDVIEKLKLGAIWAGNVDRKFWYTDRDCLASYYDGKGFLETLLNQYHCSSYRLLAKDVPSFLHPGQGVRVEIGRKSVGYLGILHPAVCREMDIHGPVCVLEIETDLLLELGNRKAKFVPYSSFPKVERDLSLVMKKTVSYADVVEEIQSLKLPAMKEVFVFDRFEGKSIPKDSVSMGYRFVFQSVEKTLTDEEIDQAIARISKRLKAKFEASARS